MAGEYRSLKKQHYLNLIKECASSGKNKQQWCSENGIKYSTFMRWQALLRNEVADQVMEQQTFACLPWISESSVTHRSFCSLFMELLFKCFTIYIGLIMLIIAFISQINKADFIIFSDQLKNSHNRRS